MNRETEKKPFCGDPLISQESKGLAHPREKSLSPKELHNLVEFLGMVLDNVYSGIIVCDTDCRILFMNRVYADLLKTDHTQAVGKHIKEYFPQSRLSRVLASGTPELGQRCSLKTDAVLLVNRIPLRSNGKTVGIILQTIFRDYKDFTDLVTKLNLLEHKVRSQKKALESVLSSRFTFDSIIGASKPIGEAKELARKFALSDSPVLILGDTGTGKELFAHAIHAASNRSSGPFVCLNCAVVPQDLLESELFGYAPGAFTGASKAGKTGQIELANEGTLYLDEIGELPINAQVKLLRVVENRVLRKLGAEKPEEVNFRLIAATNRDLRSMMSRGEFREDLYYRLSTMILRIPPLRKRTGDVRILVGHLLKTAGKQEVRVTKEAVTVLEHHEWPGNVRELKNVIHSSLVMAEGGVVDVEHLPHEVLGLHSSDQRLFDSPDRCLSSEMARFERTVLARAVELTRGNMSKAARLLGISRSTLYEKCRKYELISA